MNLQIRHPHAWNLCPSEAIRLQQDYRYLVRSEPLHGEIRRIGGVDVGFHSEKAFAALAVVAYPSMLLIEWAVSEINTPFPYIPGLLSFREAPVILSALERLSVLPDVLMVDGQGIAHPRRFGIASHLGVLLDLPAIGCAKSVLVGRYGELGNEIGNTTELLDKGEVIGMALRTRQGCKPIIVSIGHRVDLESAIRLTLACGRGYRLPEPTRLAHRIASAKKPSEGS
jgi:deoxyribonuclease V